MIPAIAKMSLSTGYVLAGLFSCDPQPAPNITINFQNNPAQFNNEKDSAYLAQLKQKAVSPEYGGEFPLVDGMTDGSFQIEHSINFSSMVRPMMHTACAGVSDISVTLIYNATVYVDNRYPPGSCRYELTKDHESKHVNTDITIINEYIPYIQKLLQTKVSQWQYNKQVPESELENAEKAMSKDIDDALNAASESMQRMRNLRQSQVDSHEEYVRVSKACPREN